MINTKHRQFFVPLSGLFFFVGFFFCDISGIATKENETSWSKIQNHKVQRIQHILLLLFLMVQSCRGG